MKYFAKILLDSQSSDLMLTAAALCCMLCMKHSATAVPAVLQPLTVRKDNENTRVYLQVTLPSIIPAVQATLTTIQLQLFTASHNLHRSILFLLCDLALSVQVCKAGEGSRRGGQSTRHLHPCQRHGRPPPRHYLLGRLECLRGLPSAPALHLCSCHLTLPVDAASYLAGAVSSILMVSALCVDCVAYDCGCRLVFT